jgi:hypothetical protein
LIRNILIWSPSKIIQSEIKTGATFEGQFNEFLERLKIIPISSDHEMQKEIKSIYGSIAFAFLIKNIYGQNIAKQAKAMQKLSEEYLNICNICKDMQILRRTVLAE